MKMITGGAFQGKSEFAVRNMGVHESEILDGGTCVPEEVFSAVCVKNFHKLVGRVAEKGGDVIDFTKKLCQENRDIIIIIDEIGCGVVPVLKSDREYRENVGRAGCIIAENSSEVYRVFSGIAVRIK